MTKNHNKKREKEGKSEKKREKKELQRESEKEWQNLNEKTFNRVREKSDRIIKSNPNWNRTEWEKDNERETKWGKERMNTYR